MMARAATETELGLLRRDNQFSRLFLFVYNPAAVFTAILAAAPASNDEVSSITYNTPTGDPAGVLDGMTLLVGSSAGADDIGIARVRSASSGTMSIGLTSEIQWQAGQHLTVLPDFMLWARKLAFTGGVWNLEGELAYSDQNKTMEPVPVLGPYFSVLRLAGAVTFSPDAAASWCPGSTVSGYAWSAPGAAATSGMTTATPTITYNAAGVYRVSCTVTAANTRTSIGHRFVYVYDDAHPPITQFELGLCSGDRDSGGWRFEATLYDEAGQSTIRPLAYAVLFADDYYGDTQQSIGPIAGCENVICQGRIDGDTITWNPELSAARFTVQGPAWWMANAPSWPISIMDTTSTPADWMHIQELTIDKAVWHLCHWRSSIDKSMDVYPPEDSRRVFDCSGNLGNLWEQLRNFTEAKIGAPPICDRYGRLFVQVDQQLLPVSSRTAVPTVMELTGADWMDTTEIEEVQHLVTSMLETAGFSYGSDWEPLLSRAPGNAMARGGSTKNRYNLIFDDQAQANALTGLLLARDNNPYPTVPVTLAQNNRLVDIAPRQYVTMTVTSSDTPRGITWSAKKLIARRVMMTYDSGSGALTTKLECEAETSGPAGITVVYAQAATSNNTAVSKMTNTPGWTQDPTDDIGGPPDPGGNYNDGSGSGGSGGYNFGGFGKFNPPPPPPSDMDCPYNPSAPANGPYNMWMSGIYYIGDAAPFAYFPCWVRGSGASNGTGYVLDMSIQQVDAYGSWITLDDDSIYTVEFVDRLGNVLAAGTHGSVSGDVRTGTFSPAAAAYGAGFRVRLTGSAFPSFVSATKWANWMGVYRGLGWHDLMVDEGSFSWQAVAGGFAVARFDGVTGSRNYVRHYDGDYYESEQDFYYTFGEGISGQYFRLQMQVQSNTGTDGYDGHTPHVDITGSPGYTFPIVGGKLDQTFYIGGIGPVSIGVKTFQYWLWPSGANAITNIYAKVSQASKRVIIRSLMIYNVCG